jgi:hypothetical protein
MQREHNISSVGYSDGYIQVWLDGGAGRVRLLPSEVAQLVVDLLNATPRTQHLYPLGAEAPALHNFDKPRAGED